MPLPRDQLPGAVFEQSSAHPERTWERHVTEPLAAITATLAVAGYAPLPQPLDEIQQLLFRMNPELVVDASNVRAHGVLGDGEGPGHIGNASS